MTPALIIMSLGVNAILNLYGLFKARYKTKDIPLDQSVVLKDGRRLFGSSTTLLGLVICVVVGLIIYLVSRDNFFAFGPLLVYAGHMTGSFIKRRVGKADGEFLPIVDHGDSIVLLSIAALIFDGYTLVQVLIAIVIVLILQPLLTFLAFKLKLRERPL